MRRRPPAPPDDRQRRGGGRGERAADEGGRRRRGARRVHEWRRTTTRHPGAFEALPRPTGRARKRSRNDATATATRTLETRPRSPRGIIVPRVRAPFSARRGRENPIVSAPRGPRSKSSTDGDGALRRSGASSRRGNGPRTATSRRRRWLLAAGVGCVHVDPARPGPRSRHTAPTQNQSPYSPAAPTHPARPLPPQVRRRAGRVRREAGVPRRHRRGPRVHRPVAPSEEGVRGRRLRATTTTEGTTIPPPDRPRGPRTRRRTATSRRRPSGRKARCNRPPPPPPRRPRRRARREEARSARPRRASGATGSRAGRDRQTPPTTTGVRRGPGRDVRPIQREFTEANGAFDPVAVADAARWFHFEPPPGVGVWPVEYTKLGLPAGCTRLVVLMLEDAPAVAAAGAACAREVMRAMRGVGCFNVSRGAYHVTVFFLSLPTDPVEDPTGENGKKSRGGAVGFHPDHDAEEAAVHDALRGAVDVAPASDASNRNGSRDNGVHGAGSNESPGRRGTRGGRSRWTAWRWPNRAPSSCSFGTRTARWIARAARCGRTFPGRLEADRPSRTARSAGVSEGGAGDDFGGALSGEGAGGRERVVRAVDAQAGGGAGEGEPRVAGAGGAVLVRGRPAVVFPPVTTGRLTAPTFRSASGVEL